MVNYIYRDPSFNNDALFNDYITQLSQSESCIEVTSLSELEKNVLSGKGLCLIFLTHELQALQQAFIGRLLSSTALPLIVNAHVWNDDNVASLLSCGRVTFVPEQLSSTRLMSLLNLAKIRFNNASNMLEKVKILDEKCSSMRFVSKAKSLLQQQGITEKVAHELIQQQAMSHGITVAEMAQKIITAAQQIKANKIDADQDDAKRSHQFGANAPAMNRVVS
ncbi:ANTAR domain-containing response regulator [Shewanella donghaensis]|uniref:ANTAR domain-containing response regulator n=1 Tax=Shewanella donghaensis TaxID=238836 RepID=UPI0011828339|nr:ANTAR domain-containing protein [Shewanella donghaensis]